MSQLQQQLAEAHTAATQAARDVAAATEASKEASAALAAAEADCAQLQQQLSEVQGQVHSKHSELALLRECMEACKGSLQQQVAGLQAELQQQRSRSEALQGQCDEAARSRERELAQVGPVTAANADFWTFPASSGAACLVYLDRLCVVNSHGKSPPCQEPALLLSLSKLHFLLCRLQAQQDAGAPLKARTAALSQQLRVAHRELQAAEQRAEASGGELQQARLRAARAENLVARAEERRAAAEQECSRLQGASGKLQQQVGCALGKAGKAASGCTWLCLARCSSSILMDMGSRKSNQWVAETFSDVLGRERLPSGTHIAAFGGGRSPGAGRVHTSLVCMNFHLLRVLA